MKKIEKRENETLVCLMAGLAKSWALRIRKKANERMITNESSVRQRSDMPQGPECMSLGSFPVRRDTHTSRRKRCPGGVPAQARATLTAVAMVD